MDTEQAEIEFADLPGDADARTKAVAERKEAAMQGQSHKRREERQPKPVRAKGEYKAVTTGQQKTIDQAAMAVLGGPARFPETRRVILMELLDLYAMHARKAWPHLDESEILHRAKSFGYLVQHRVAEIDASGGGRGMAAGVQ